MKKPAKEFTLYRARLSCKVGRNAVEGKITPPCGLSPLEWAIYNLLHAVEDIAGAMEKRDEKKAESKE
jgi:protein involved in temperature-dependent protein secretion